jgi:hypothetical protein
MDLRRVLLRVLGLALLATGFFLAVSAIVGLGNDAGPVEAILMFLGAGALAVVGWMIWDRAGSLPPRTGRPLAS